MTVESLWPDDIAAEYIKTLDTPIGIMRHQGALLASKTSGKVRATVESEGTNGSFLHRFVIQAVRYTNLRYVLFTATHGLTLYPVHTMYDGGLSQRELRDKEQFCEELRTIFASNRTRLVISGLVAQIE